MDSSGNLYGTTNSFGATGGCDYGGGCGTVFKVAPDGTETTLYTFTGGTDGGMSNAGLIMDNAGNLYGTTKEGGLDTCSVGYPTVGCGVVFKVAPDGTEAVLYTFTNGGDGATPEGPLVMDAASNLYGTTFNGGAGYFGVVFKLTPGGIETPLYQFQDRTDGMTPYAGLTLYRGELYGTNTQGGDDVDCSPYGVGTVFKLKK
jgi:uncharacterized repeat protein (TIGR03803 family)